MAQETENSKVHLRSWRSAVGPQTVIPWCILRISKPSTEGNRFVCSIGKIIDKRKPEH